MVSKILQNHFWARHGVALGDPATRESRCDADGGARWAPAARILNEALSPLVARQKLIDVGLELKASLGLPKQATHAEVQSEIAIKRAFDEFRTNFERRLKPSLGMGADYVTVNSDWVDPCVLQVPMTNEMLTLGKVNIRGTISRWSTYFVPFVGFMTLYADLVKYKTLVVRDIDVGKSRSPGLKQAIKFIIDSGCTPEVRQIHDSLFRGGQVAIRAKLP